MKLKLIFIIILIVNSTYAEYRIWTDKKGHEIDAEFVCMSSGKVVLKRKNGGICKTSQGSLSDKDLCYLKSINPSENLIQNRNVEETIQHETVPLDSLKEFRDYFEIMTGAKTSGYRKMSTYDIDRHKDGNTLSLESDGSTTRWLFFGKQLRTNCRKVELTYEIFCKNIKQENNQFDNCYIGFVYTDKFLKRKFKVTNYNGSWGWKKETISIRIENTNDETVEMLQLGIMLSKSGEIKFRNITIHYYN